VAANPMPKPQINKDQSITLRAFWHDLSSFDTLAVRYAICGSLIPSHGSAVRHKELSVHQVGDRAQSAKYQHGVQKIPAETLVPFFQ
jgi:hypothetical protein